MLFVPTFSPVVLEKGNWQTLYVGAGNILKYPSQTEDFTLNSFRGYFQLMAGDEPASDPLAPTLAIVSNMDDHHAATALPSLVPPESEGWGSERPSSVFYDLQGRRVANGQQPTAKGLYIVNGRKVVVK